MLFFLYPAIERSESLLAFANSAVPVTSVDVPGDANKTYKKSSEEARKSTAALTCWLTDLHSHGYCLDGNMKASDFGIAHTGRLRGEQHLLEKVARIGEKKQRRKDMKAVADIIQDGIYASIEPNPDVADLLFLLRKFKKRYYPLIVCHVCHYREVMMSAIYTKMFDYLMTLKVKDKTKYDAIIKQLPHESDWMSKVRDNIHLLAVLRIKPVPANKVNTPGAETAVFLTTCARYPQTVEGLLEFRCNGQARLEKDYSMDLLHKKASFTAAIAALHKIQPPLPLGVCQQTLHIKVAAETVRAIERTLQAQKSSCLEVAAAAAAAAAEAIVTSRIPVPTKSTGQTTVGQAAQAAAIQAAQAAAAASFRNPTEVSNAVVRCFTN